MNYDPIDFSKNLVKGRIAETLFEQMLRDTGLYTILAFGYENIIPELMHRQHDMKTEKTMEVIRRAPDFAVINNNTHDVHLIEVKYRKKMQSLSLTVLVREQRYGQNTPRQDNRPHALGGRGRSSTRGHQP